MRKIFERGNDGDTYFYITDFGNIEETKLIPYVFTQICEMPVDEFNEQLQEILAKTKKYTEIIFSVYPCINSNQIL